MEVSVQASRRAAQLLKQARREKQLTGVQAAAMCRLSGSQYSRMENGLVRYWGEVATRGAAEIMDLTVHELEDILNDAPPPIWQKDLLAFKEEMLAELHAETDKIIAASDELQEARIERQKEFMTKANAEFMHEVSAKVNLHQKENVEVIKTTVVEAGAILHQEAQQQLKSSMDALFEGGETFMHTVQAVINKGIQGSHERNEHLTERSNELEQMIKDLRNVTTQITADFESELANLKRMIGGFQNSFESQSGARTQLLLDLNEAIENMKEYSDEQFEKRTDQINDIRKFQEEKFSALSD